MDDHLYSLNHYTFLNVLEERYGNHLFYAGNISATVRNYYNGTLEMEDFPILLLAEDLMPSPRYFSTHTAYNQANRLLSALAGHQIKDLRLHQVEPLTPKGTYSYRITRTPNDILEV